VKRVEENRKRRRISNIQHRISNIVAPGEA
jgi:hypothetical protein